MGHKIMGKYKVNTKQEVMTEEVKLKEHIQAQFVNELRDTAKKYEGCESLREAISRIVDKYVGGNIVDQIKSEYRTFIFARVEKDGKFTDCTATSNVDSKDIDKVVSIIRKADKQEYKF